MMCLIVDDVAGMEMLQCVVVDITFFLTIASKVLVWKHASSDTFSLRMFSIYDAKGIVQKTCYEEDFKIP